jgi:sensor histidine kinase YesM
MSLDDQPSEMTRPIQPADPHCAPVASLPGKALELSGYGSFLVRALWIVGASTLAVFLIFLSTGRIRLSQSGYSIVGSLVYSACIALPSIFLLTRAAVLYTERFPRLIVLIQGLLLVFTATLGSFAAAGILVFAGVIPPSGYGRELHESLPFCLTIALIFGLSISTFETMRYRLQDANLQLRTRQVEQERAYKLLAEARLSSLESRIHPHFLFNALNSIAALIPSDPQRAEQTVGNLASLLRFSLNAHHGGLVPLSQELKIVRDYLEIEKTRFGTRLRYEIDVPESLSSVQVPPLALQSLAENAVKHVVGQRPEGASIRVAGSRAGNRIQLAVLDDGPGFSLDAISPEHGLGNLIDRIELLYGAEGRLEVTQENGQNAVRMSFPA